MKLILPCIMMLFISTNVNAQGYRLLYSANDGIAITIENATDSNPSAWCNTNIPVRIDIDDQAMIRENINQIMLQTTQILIQSACPKITRIDLSLNYQQQLITEGFMIKNPEWEISWEPAIINATYPFPAMDQKNLTVFQTLNNCQWHNVWPDTQTPSQFFIADKPSLTCEQQWLDGKTEMKIVSYNKRSNESLYFLKGYPILNFPQSLSDDYERNPQDFTINDVNSQVLLLAASIKNVPAEKLPLKLKEIEQQQMLQYFFILPYNNEKMAWEFSQYILAISKEEDIQQYRRIIAKGGKELYQYLVQRTDNPIIVLTNNKEAWLNKQDSNTKQVITFE